jgi:hypothetical protein
VGSADFIFQFFGMRLSASGFVAYPLAVAVCFLILAVAWRVMTSSRARHDDSTHLNHHS